jgi:DNA-binding MarR family transcriptional regulator
MSATLTLEDQIVVAIRRISRAIDRRSRTLLQDFGLTAPQLAILSAIRRMQPVPAGRIAHEVHLAQATVTDVLNRLERRELIERVRGDLDRRSVNVSLTSNGKRVLDSAPSLLEGQFVAELARLREWERTQILATLQRIADMLHANHMVTVPELDRDFAVAALAETSLPLDDAPLPEFPAEVTSEMAGWIHRSVDDAAEHTDLIAPISVEAVAVDGNLDNR